MEPVSKFRQFPVIIPRMDNNNFGIRKGKKRMMINGVKNAYPDY